MWTEDIRVRRQLGLGEKHDLPSRFWEPEPDEEDLKRIEEEKARAAKDQAKGKKKK